MKVLVQRSLKSSVFALNKTVGKINFGLVLFVGFCEEDNIDTIDYLVKKIINLRIFDDENGIMNKSITDVKGEILSVSQFTLYADTSKGNRPSYKNSLKSEEAVNLYHIFNKRLQDNGIKVETGIFGENMQINIQNDGPVTIMLER